MQHYNVIIIGAGLGGLECGFALSKLGQKVCVLEKEPHTGGCLQTFTRHGTVFDTGFHYVGGLDKGQPLYDLFRYFKLTDLPWQRLDNNCFDEVCIGNQCFPFANGHEHFVETLTPYFPKHKTELQQFTALLKDVGDHIYDSFTRTDGLDRTLFAQSAYDFLNRTISDPLLRKVLSGTSLKMELCPETLPLYVFAQINNSYIQSAWRLRGGGHQIADQLTHAIKNMGGIVRPNAEVTQLIENNGKISQIEINHQEVLTSDWVISDVHPAYTLSLVSETRLLRHFYRKRIANLHNTYGMFTANLRLQPDIVPYRNHNTFIYAPTADPWHRSNTTDRLMISYAVPESGNAAVNVDLLTPMSWNAVASWKGTKVGQRGDDYEQLKQHKLQECLQLAATRLPELPDAIAEAYTSTPLSNSDYTNTVCGSAYGICKDYTNPLATILTPRTPIENLLLTGQNLNLHGILGVSMTAIFTCAVIVGMSKMLKELGL